MTQLLEGIQLVYTYPEPVVQSTIVYALKVYLIFFIVCIALCFAFESHIYWQKIVIAAKPC